MGLDMYLRAEKYLGWREEDKTKSAILELFPELAAIKAEPKSISFEVMYWRKSNQIHSWFVDNCQDGVDECQNTEVSREQLQTLLGLCKAVLADHSKAKELLEPQGGFFFGSTDIDDWYFKDLEQTVEGLEKALTLPDEWDFQYHSSW